MMHQDTVQFSHPETRRGEVFLANMSAEMYRCLDWKSKRLGRSAYDGDGNEISFADWHPVFLEKRELMTRGVSLTALRRELRDLP